MVAALLAWGCHRRELDFAVGALDLIRIGAVGNGEREAVFPRRSVSYEHSEYETVSISYSVSVVSVARATTLISDTLDPTGRAVLLSSCRDVVNALTYSAPHAVWGVMACCEDCDAIAGEHDVALAVEELRCPDTDRLPRGPRAMKQVPN